MNQFELGLQQHTWDLWIVLACAVASVSVELSLLTTCRPEAIMLKILPIILFYNSLEIVPLFPNYFPLFSHFL